MRDLADVERCIERSRLRPATLADPA